MIVEHEHPLSFRHWVWTRHQAEKKPFECYTVEGESLASRVVKRKNPYLYSRIKRQFTSFNENIMDRYITLGRGGMDVNGDNIDLNMDPHAGQLVERRNFVDIHFSKAFLGSALNNEVVALEHPEVIATSEDPLVDIRNYVEAYNNNLEFAITPAKLLPLMNQ
ncbi:hypothetical protein BDA99DRAFT_542078 [Phascolomyces articulosus]|uniref:Uncharacterized protein n=1 Tax=Phascolomyces articulosus TaxID=60185 RepID=A0AAD5JR69_9FUNG|nr:hypothetical protein BDA99DRAFT_542078 [Phascolomyces articulosus]